MLLWYLYIYLMVWLKFIVQVLLIILECYNLLEEMIV